MGCEKVEGRGGDVPDGPLGQLEFGYKGEGRRMVGEIVRKILQ